MKKLLNKINNFLIIRAVEIIKDKDKSIEHLKAEKAELYSQLYENDMYSKIVIKNLKETIKDLERKRGVNIYA